MKILGIIGLVLIAAVALGFILASIKREQKYQEKFSVKPGSPLKVYNKNGGIEVNSWDKDYVEVAAVKKRNLLNYLFEVPGIDVAVGNEFIVRTINSSTWCFAVPVNYRITVPKGMLVKYLETSTGGINITNITGDIKITTSTGGIQASDVSGNIDAETSTGGIKIKKVDGFVKAITSTGGIDIAGAKGIHEARTSTGGISVEVASFRDTLNIVAQTGGITALLSPSITGQLEASTSMGKITYEGLSIATSESTNRRLAGKLGDKDGGKINIKTSTGSITLKKLND